MEPSGRNPSQSAANGMPAKTAQTSETVAVGATSCLSRSMVRNAMKKGLPG